MHSLLQYTHPGRGVLSHLWYPAHFEAGLGFSTLGAAGGGGGGGGRGVWGAARLGVTTSVTLDSEGLTATGDVLQDKGNR